MGDLARHARLERYMAGESLVRQGDAGRSLFVVRSGDVRIERTDGGSTRELARALSAALEERTRSQARVETPAAGAVGSQAITEGLLDRIQRFFGLEG